MLFSKRYQLNAHWCILLDDFRFTPKNFYQLLRKELRGHNVKKLGFKEKLMSTGNIVRGKRLYLRIRWHSYVYDCCFATFGNNTYVSYWMFSEKTGFQLFLSRIPLIGFYLEKVFYPTTYYSIDTASMFRSHVQTSMLKVIDNITKENGYDALPKIIEKPVLHDIFKR